MRDWKRFNNDEIYAIWKEYERYEFQGYDPLNHSPVRSKTIRLTPMEIIRLVDELIDRLEIKEKVNDE